MAKFTLAFLPSIMGLGSLQALSAASLVAIITWKEIKGNHSPAFDQHDGIFDCDEKSLPKVFDTLE